MGREQCEQQREQAVPCRRANRHLHRPVGGLNLPTSVAIDAGENAWITNTNNSLTQISATGTGTNHVGGGLNAPKAIAIGGLGMIWAGNGGSTTLSAFGNTGSPISGSPFAVVPGNRTGEVAVGINPR